MSIAIMKTKITFNNQTFYNPTRKTTSKILRKSPAYYEISLYLMKTRLKPSILNKILIHGKHKTKNGGILIMKKNMVYLIIGGIINSISDLRHLKKIFEKSKEEVIFQAPTYPENIRKVETFHKLLGLAWKKNS